MINGNLAGGSIPHNLPFNMIIDTIRRKKFKDAFMANDPIKREEGEKVRKVSSIFFFYKKIYIKKNFSAMKKNFLLKRCLKKKLENTFKIFSFFEKIIFLYLKKSVNNSFAEIFFSIL